jgi:hypothetical protein
MVLVQRSPPAPGVGKQIFLCSVQQESGVVDASVLGVPVRSEDLSAGGVLERVRSTQARCVDAGEVDDGDRHLHGGQGSARSTKRNEDDAGHDPLAHLAAEEWLHLQGKDPKHQGGDKCNQE